MYEEVCLICGRPVLADGRPYCSDQCESTDVTSPSVSTTSSAQPSPFLNSTANVPGALAEVPALLPSTLGRSLREAHQTHRVRHSVSSSSNSSVSWSALEEDYDEESAHPALYSAGTDEEFGVRPDYLSAEAGSSKSSSSYGNVYRNPNSSLAYVRRPSTTNNRSMIPTLHHRTSSASTPSSNGVSQSVPYYCSTEDDASDVPSASASSISGRSGRRLGRKSTDSVPQIMDESEREKDDTVTAKNRRNRASLPAYFSLLTSTSPAGSRSQKSLSSLQTLSMISRSLQSSSSPPTPRLAKPLVDTTTAFATAQMGRVTRPHIVTADAAPRGRSRQRDPDGRSSSSRRSPSRSPRARAHAHHNAHARARLDSLEKVADWVAHSPVVAASVRMARQQVHHHPHHRRNSSPPPLPKFEKSRHDSGVDLDIGYINSAVDELDEEDECEEPEQERGSRRGRRRTDELDKLPPCVDRSAPGYGNGRSGLMARERSRGRTATLKR